MIRADHARTLDDLLRGNALLMEVLRRLSELDLPEWYLGAGAVAQTVWNAAHGFGPAAGFKDFDVVYYDSDLSAATELAFAQMVGERLDGLDVEADVNNQARVHLWYPACFGQRIRAYESCADAFLTWPTTATAVGVRLEGDMIRVEAPFGLDDLLSLVVRPNRVLITPRLYTEKASRWAQQWPLLRILDWDDGVGEPGSRRIGT